MAALFQGGVDQFARRHLKARMDGADASGDPLQHLVIGAALAGRIDQLRPDRDMLVAAAEIEIVVLHEHRRRQHDIGHHSRFRHELLMHDNKQVLARKALTHQRLFGRHCHRVGVLDQHRLDRRAAMQHLAIAGQDPPDLRLIEHAHAVVDRIEAFDDRFIESPDAAIVEEGAATFVLPGAGDRGNAQRCMHLRGAIAAAGETIAKAEEGPLGPTDRACEGLDFVHRHA